ncbi:hypothetical protein CAC42_4307 [Sphaceloma murrayae]|uniref:Uncharacterized protein n=1 Tax=Sphaceloma murrayae TaxID=2082308 RepID=A0A2K1QL17_9PEZI|nr:hypothetical protein CAC42_4307 [Sphaceloma murrayae]
MISIRNPLHVCTKAFRLQIPSQSDESPALQHGHFYVCQESLYCYTTTNTNDFICTRKPPFYSPYSYDNTMSWSDGLPRTADPSEYANALSAQLEGKYGDGESDLFATWLYSANRFHGAQVVAPASVSSVVQEISSAMSEPSPTPYIIDPAEIAKMYEPAVPTLEVQSIETAAPGIIASAFHDIWDPIVDMWSAITGSPAYIYNNFASILSSLGTLSTICLALVTVFIWYCLLNEYRCKDYDLRFPERERIAYLRYRKTNVPERPRYPPLDAIIQRLKRRMNWRDRTFHTYDEKPKPTTGEDVTNGVLAVVIPTVAFCMWIAPLTMWALRFSWYKIYWAWVDGKQGLFQRWIYEAEHYYIGLELNYLMLNDLFYGVLYKKGGNLFFSFLEASAVGIRDAYIAYQMFSFRRWFKQWIWKPSSLFLVFSIIVGVLMAFTWFSLFTVPVWWEGAVDMWEDVYYELPSRKEMGAGIRNKFVVRPTYTITVSTTSTLTTDRIILEPTTVSVTKDRVVLEPTTLTFTETKEVTSTQTETETATIKRYYAYGGNGTLKAGEKFNVSSWAVKEPDRPDVVVKEAHIQMEDSDSDDIFLPALDGPAPSPRRIHHRRNISSKAHLLLGIDTPVPHSPQHKKTPAPFPLRKYDPRNVIRRVDKSLPSGPSSSILETPAQMYAKSLTPGTSGTQWRDKELQTRQSGEARIEQWREEDALDRIEVEEMVSGTEHCRRDAVHTWIDWVSSFVEKGSGPIDGEVDRAMGASEDLCDVEVDVEDLCGWYEDFGFENVVFEGDWLGQGSALICLACESVQGGM